MDQINTPSQINGLSMHFTPILSSSGSRLVRVNVISWLGIELGLGHAI